MSKIRIALPRMPSDEELHASYSEEYALFSPTYIDQWPDDLRALSFPTKLVPIDAGLLRDAFWDHKPDYAKADQIAAALDAEMGWNHWFVRLNSRSPKDASYPGLPITCSGKQAVAWIGSSERCLEDSGIFYHARKPMFVCLRKWKWMAPEGEFRCLAKDGALLGVSRYFYDQDTPIEMDETALWGAAQRFYDTHLRERYPTIVFDLYAPGSPEELLIEINPYGRSDPCLFVSYAELEANPGVRLHAPQNLAREGALSRRATTNLPPALLKGEPE